jgi:D-sedoheptulose 7-phosphate isomerase
LITKIEKIIDDHIAVANLLKLNGLEIERVAQTLFRAIASGNKILLAGNGGSAADCQHFAAELVGRFELERHGLPAIALTTDSSALTAIGNDYGFNKIFSRQLEALGKRGDVFLGITTSGASENINAAISISKELELKTIMLTSTKAFKRKIITDDCIKVQSNVTARIQEMHILSIHIICSLIDQYLSEAEK